jgi:hypothetical protein
MRARSLLLFVATLITSSGTLVAQECVGIPKGGKGFLALGPSGTDGASGTGISFAFHGANRSILTSYQSLGVFAYANQQKTRALQANFRVKALHGCVTTAAKWQAWDTERDDNASWSIDDPDVIIERHTIGGNYDRLRIPVGLSFGRTISWKSISVTPYANPFVAFENEQLKTHQTDTPPETHIRSAFGGGLEFGFGLRAGWFTTRSLVNVTNTRDRALSGKKNWADLAMHFGVVF